MNDMKIDINTKLDGAITERLKKTKLKSSQKFLNFPISPNNKDINSLKLGNIKDFPVSKLTGKGNSSDDIMADNLKRIPKQNSSNNLDSSNNVNNNQNNNTKNINFINLIF